MPLIAKHNSFTEVKKEKSKHYYNEHGDLVETVIGANGKERSVRITDVRKGGLWPSVTTILDTGAEDFVVRWREGKTIDTCFKTPAHLTEKMSDYRQRVRILSEIEMSKVSELGSRIHNELEQGALGKGDTAYGELGAKVMKELGIVAVQTEVALNPRSVGYGGKIDVVGYTAEGTDIMVDWKTKDGDIERLKKQKPTEKHKCQLAAYANGWYGFPPHLYHASLDQYIVYVSRTDPSAYHVAWIGGNLEREWYIFETKRKLFDLQNKL